MNQGLTAGIIISIQVN